MVYKGKDTFKEKIAMQNKYQTAFRIPDEPGMLLYHYAGMETIWKILESDCFFARNIRFSNDAEEYKLGEKKIKEYADGIFTSQEQREKFHAKIQQGIQMFYMICFCREGDLLSQWRGYAKDGVSLGMDFLEEEENHMEHTEMFTVLNNTASRKDGKYKLDGNFVRFVEMPYRVFYVDKDEGTEEEETQQNGKRALLESVSHFDDEDERINMLLNLIPFIKDKGFKEEAEYRLLFDISNLGKTEAQNRRLMCRKIEYIEKDGRKLPNIIVEPGDGEKKLEKVNEVLLGAAIGERAKQLGMSADEREEIYRTITQKMLVGGIKCIRNEKKKDIYIGEGNNQEDIMSEIEDILQEKGLPIEYDTGMKIWCRGHLPIREVIVGPGEKTEKIRESLKHYMRNTYWLRYVTVKESGIPLQS